MINKRTTQKIIALAWLAGFFVVGFGAWNFQGGEFMLIGYALLGAAGYMICAFSYRCPKCRMPVLLKPLRLLGIEIYLWSFVAPQVCRHCGEPLGEK